MKFFWLFSLFALLIGCTPENTPPKPTVDPAAMAEFFQVVKRKEYHQMARTGRELFEPGLYIPDHTEQFEQFPASEYGPGRIRYVFYSFEGEASAGEVYLILEQDSGKVIEFNYFEAFFE